jgi:peptidoglycan-N-acetylglucosamine deacetylase
MLYPVRPPYLLKRYYHRFTWSIPSETRNVYLTFDDGPTPGVTEFVLDALGKFNAKATFFCIGSNVIKHPLLYRRILDEGHRTGNHTFNHPNGWLCTAADYLSDVDQAAQVIDSNLFRPPYGRIRKQQSDFILQHYRIVMWDVLSYDFNNNLSPQKCLSNVINHCRPGSIIVFHDSLKASTNLKYTLPLLLEYLSNKSYKFLSIL